MISMITVSLKDLVRFDTPFTNHCRASDKQKPKSKYVLNVIYSLQVGSIHKTVQLKKGDLRFI